VAPFVCLLLSIAIIPAVSHRWWARHYPKVSASLAAVTGVYYSLSDAGITALGHVAREYLSFIALLASLFIIAGGIHIHAPGGARPRQNATFLLAGAILANAIGTTGASMLLIRPWIRMNQRRFAGFHLVFFIFLVGNIGGGLTPIGDPPLFLGFIAGVPFWWTLRACWAPWAVAVSVLLGAFLVLDGRSFRRGEKTALESPGTAEKRKVEGARNALFLGIVLGAVFVPQIEARAGLMALSALVCYVTTPKRIYAANEFNFGPAREVAWLFGAIFITMMPALAWLQANSAQLPVGSPRALFWLTGGLSAALDNAPTYLAALAASLGRAGLSLQDPAQVNEFVRSRPDILVAISLGAVFFGAMTYLGNGPNLLARAIAQNAKISTPGFFEFVWRYAAPLLIPLFALISLLFLGA